MTVWSGMGRRLARIDQHPERGVMRGQFQHRGGAGSVVSRAMADGDAVIVGADQQQRSTFLSSQIRKQVAALLFFLLEGFLAPRDVQRIQATGDGKPARAGIGAFADACDLFLPGGGKGRQGEQQQQAQSDEHAGQPDEAELAALERMGLDAPHGVREHSYRALILGALRSAGQ